VCVCVCVCVHVCVRAHVFAEVAYSCGTNYLQGIFFLRFLYMELSNYLSFVL